uniref:Methyltransferase domain-containing protein n=1 Tax=Candidatus Kentrum eta TaxID=2126337 RepID=A0A450VSM7_9GAMM|nr:MAG: Methyltransferase domain-containing protein [Candidatus Kentron sp. H]VFK04531.1 MAG: Methyltransferase domain-containing protein [Candidatus Kentron sp. H]VFK07805.1 MAG: Methyltransferase domain-containing protein [Candidatus Kentron sp. H]
MADLPPSTSEKIAQAAGLKAVFREWLAAMVVGRIIDHDPTAGHYHLPSENAAALTRVAGADNMARLALVVPSLASVQEDIIAAFFQGGGVSYSSYPGFMKLWAEINTERFDASINPTNLSTLMPNVMEKMHEGIEILEVGCGNGHALCLMAKAFPDSRFTGYDLLEDGIEVARDKKRALGLSNVDFHAGDVTTFDEPNRYGLITAFDVIHDMARPDAALRWIFDSLKEGGTFLMVNLAASSNLHENLDHPLGSWLYTTSCMHCMPVSLALDGAGLGAM